MEVLMLNDFDFGELTTSTRSCHVQVYGTHVGVLAPSCICVSVAACLSD
jgi:hypothetical protein